jgi:hypothetical protein
MASGVLRPYTLVDVLGSINGQNSATVDTSTSGLGVVAEGDDQTAWSDSTTSQVLVGIPGWDQEVWGGSVWQ